MNTKTKRPRFQYRATFANGQTLTFETASDPSEILPNAIDIKTIGVAPDFQGSRRIVCKNRIFGVTE